jgi:hypothetical protein
MFHCSGGPTFDALTPHHLGRDWHGAGDHRRHQIG